MYVDVRPAYEGVRMSRTLRVFFSVRGAANPSTKAMITGISWENSGVGLA